MTCRYKGLNTSNDLHGWMPRGLVSTLELGRTRALVEDPDATAVQTRPDPELGSGRRKWLILLRKRRRRPDVQTKMVFCAHTRTHARPQTRTGVCLRACTRTHSNTHTYWTTGRLDGLSIHAGCSRPDPTAGLDGFDLCKGELS